MSKLPRNWRTVTSLPQGTLSLEELEDFLIEIFFKKQQETSKANVEYKIDIIDSDDYFSVMFTTPTMKSVTGKGGLKMFTEAGGVLENVTVNGDKLSEEELERFLDRIFNEEQVQVQTLQEDSNENIQQEMD